MKALPGLPLLLGVTLTAFAAFQPARAEKVGKYETYCLETRMGGGGRDGGGGTYFDCRFATMAQCYASKVGQGDQCWLNPRLAFDQRNRRDHY